jgi:hypothetical protein
MGRGPCGVLLAPVLAVMALGTSPAWAQLPPPRLPTLDGLPRPAAPPLEKGPVVPARVERWREEAKALEHGDGVPRDPVRAAELYCRAARHGDAEAQYSLGWMLVNAIDMQHCPNCGAGELKIIAAILERPVIEKILTHLGLDPQPPPRGRACEAGQDFAA